MNKTRVPVHKNQPVSAPAEAPYDRTHPIVPLGLAITIVGDGVGSYVVSQANKHQAATNFICSGRGTARNDFYEVLGIGDEKKQIVMTVLRMSEWTGFKEDLAKKLNTSYVTRGVSVLLPMSALGGISTYKFLSNQREAATAAEEKTMSENQGQFDTIFAIVNDGFSDIVMTAAKQAGARGGTILSARGTGNDDIEKFYGVRITPEKEVVMIVVDHAIKEAVLQGVNQAVGFNTKGQGIIFAIPTSDIYGIAPEEKTEGEGATNGQ